MLATDSKAALIAKDFTQLYGRALKFTNGAIRKALLAELVLGIVTAQEETHELRSDDIFNLRQLAEERLKAKFGTGFFD